ncbi:MAG: tRNA (uridine(34)/cytosine(34)/5-carboxymethylaminomethyluridine(34)-2'-O)-methyltransferase TrmL [Coriobacteriia bacterium]|nr:MAG: tRNA (uridine(34)/cytosine(34)/5-carboxymethylaminomethyluridine(34)-2'-O)-methyltransferase TrmL [Coriobacteriia bacterium]
MLNVVLFQPEIPANTGTIGRSCVLTNTRLHLIGPLGFSLDDRMVRRSGMGYWHDIDLITYDSYDEFLAQNPDARLWMFTKRADAYYHEVSYADGDYLMFGRESTGIDDAVLAAHPERCLRIPMIERDGLSPVTTPGPLSDPTDPDAVSLNLSNAANIVLFEALRQLGFPGVI